MRQIISLIFIVSLFHHSQINSQTDLSGGDVFGTWEKNGSPYLINDDIVIPDDSTLVIEPGVKIEFHGHYQLEVQGVLLAEGTETDSIIFTVNDTTGFYDPDTSLGGWNGINIIDPDTTNDSTKLSYCRIEYAKAVGDVWHINSGGALTIINFDKVEVSHNLFNNNSAGGDSTEVPSGGAIHLAWADIILVSNTFKNNRAVSGGAIQMHESNPFFTANIFKNNYASNNGGAIAIGWKSSADFIEDRFEDNSAKYNGGALACWDSTKTTLRNVMLLKNMSNDGGAVYETSAALIVSNSSFLNNEAAVIGGAVNSFRSDNKIDSCKFENNRASIFGGGTGFYESDVQINNSEFKGNYSVILGGAIHTDYSKITIDNSKFESDSASNSGGGIFAWQSDLEIDKSEFVNNIAKYSGGGIYTDSTAMTLDNCSITDNAATDNGGGVFLNRSQTLINNTSFELNRAVWGGGVFSGYGELNLNNNSFVENSSEHGGALNFGFGSAEINNVSFIKNSGIWGGGVCASNCDLNVDSCLFSQNEAESEGGAIEYMVDSTIFGRNYKFSLYESEFMENSAAYRSGAVRIEQTTQDFSMVDLVVDSCQFNGNHSFAHGSLRIAGPIEGFILSNSIFNGNTAERNTGGPGFMSKTKGVVYNCVFNSNYALFSDTTKAAHGVSLQTEAEVNFINCTIVDTSSAAGYALSARRGANANLLNCILWGCGDHPIILTTVADLACTVKVNYCDIENGIDSIQVSDSLSLFNWEEGNISEDPLFVDMENADLHLQNASPCNGSGIDSKEINGIMFYSPSTDIEGNSRPNPSGTMPDMGAYESQYAVQVEDNKLTIPKEYSLEQNYPNPFNPSTVISYQLPVDSKVVLKVFDVLGREVASLVNKEQSAGKYEVEFSGSSIGRRITSGIYFYRIQVYPANGGIYPAEGGAGDPSSSSGQGFVATKKMLLLR